MWVSGLFVTLSLLGAVEPPMPAPPPGMWVVAQAELPPTPDAGTTPELDAGQPDAGPVDAGIDVMALKRPTAAATPADVDDDEGDDDEIDEMKAMEQAAIDPKASQDATVRAALSRLGYGSLLRDRLEGALDAANETGVELPFSLAPVTDVSNFDVSLVRDRYDIPVEMRPLVAQFIHFFQGAGRKWFRKWMGRSTRFIPVMQPILEAKGLPRDTVYLAMIESGFNTQAKSWAKAVGPWQFIAGTAKLFNLKEDFWVDERRDPLKATAAAANYLGLMYQTLGHWYLAWAGYNTGGGRVRWLIDKAGTNDFWELSTVKHGFAQETVQYVPKLIACALVAKHPEAFGFTQDEFEFEPTFEFDEVKLTDAVDLEVLATSAGTTVEVLEELNPELKRWCTPPATEKEPYVLRIPKGRAEAFAENFARYATGEHLHFKVHRIAKGDTLSKIAAQYHSAQEAILRVNGLKSARSLKLGSDLVVPVPSAGAMKAGKADVALERQVARARRGGFVASRPDEEIPAGSQIVTVKTQAGGSVQVEKVDGKTRVTYGVASGDSLWTIARRFDVRVADLKEWNDSLAQSRGLKVGASMVIFPGPAADLSGAGAKPAAKKEAAPEPKKAGATPAAPHGTRHTVESGDSLWTIAQKYGTSVGDLKRWNGLEGGKLKKGQVLVVSGP
jgi:membrane-bound lytic murein transglycosylase D